MTDFIFSSQPQKKGVLVNSLQDIKATDSNSLREHHGDWGSLAVSPTHYYGFSALESDDYICVVIGGPVLYFQSNDFIGGNDPQAGTRAILERWQTGSADWSEDLSGPFAILVVDKTNLRVECITDMMMFIPVYQHLENDTVFWGTHIDALAQACGQQHAVDETSLVDFVLHHAITYPYTAYRDIRQAQPGSVHHWRGEKASADAPLNVEFYWRPIEANTYPSISDAAQYLRDGVQGYIDRVTGSLNHVAQFVSAGEDSRSLAGLLPPRLERDGYIFLDSMNREGRVAQEVAKAYDINFKPDYRSKTHYLDILPEASDLVGSGHQYTHAHTLGFDRKHNLASYPAVFGGYIADSLLKSQYARVSVWFRRFPFLPQMALKGEMRTERISNSLFSSDLLAEITKRRREHFLAIQGIRPETAHEWFELWPATMRIAIPNLYSNRRLFASHEVFMAKESVKVAASVPTSWKLNRRLFYRAFKPVLIKTRFIFHADGRLPYYPWWVNSAIQIPVWAYRKIVQHAGVQRKNEGPWADWLNLLASPRWADEVKLYSDRKLPVELSSAVNKGAMTSSELSVSSKVNLLQACYQLSGKVGCKD